MFAASPSIQEINFTKDMANNMTKLAKSYSTFLATRNYASIPTDQLAYTNLLLFIQKYQKTLYNPNLLNLLNIAQDALKGSLNASLLYQTNLGQTLRIGSLENEVQDILAGKNEKASITATSTLSVQKTFKLAPLYSMYISLYGCPLPGVGFDPNKLNLLMHVFQTYNISF